MDKKKIVSMIVLLTGITLFAPTWACDAAGSYKHVGQITSVDKEAGTFTLLDAQTGNPITFMASTEMMAMAEMADGQVMVSYSEAENGLTAESIN